MTISHDLYPESERPTEAWCDVHEVHVRRVDGRHVSTPLWWYPRLLNATPAQRNNVRLMFADGHWPDIDEDLSIQGMFADWKAPGAKAPEKAA